MVFPKIMLIILGTLSLAVGIIGIIVPGLPTTVFLLITAGLYVKSSDRMYNWLISHKILGSYIRDFRENRGMTKKIKVYSIITMWIMISISTIFLVDNLIVRLIIWLLGLVGTAVMGFVVRTIEDR